MEKYIIEYTDYNEILGLLGHEITHSKLENVSTIIVDLTEEEYETLIILGLKYLKIYLQIIIYSTKCTIQRDILINSPDQVCSS